MVHSFWGMTMSGGAAFFGSKLIENSPKATKFLQDLKIGESGIRLMLLTVMIGIYLFQGRIEMVKMNDLLDLRTTYGRELMSVAMQLYPNKVNYNLIQE